MMKIPKSIRDSYYNQLPCCERLKEEVDGLVKKKMEGQWHYFSRRKEIESYALKIETGRCLNPSWLEDYFACTLVVENIDQIKKAEEFVRREFNFHNRNPRMDSLTEKRPESFQFDDLRLRVRWRDDPTLPPTGLTNLIFEVQIKTFLQHAWSIATHDFIYKSDEISWSKARIAYQIKAMLEHAETSIYEAKALSDSRIISKTDIIAKKTSEIIRLVTDLWTPNALPKNIKRLAENIYCIIKHIGIGVIRLRNILRIETELGNGTKTLNLSPYSVVVQSLFNQERPRMRKLLLDPECRINYLYLRIWKSHLIFQKI